jgi:hypothetical protein
MGQLRLIVLSPLPHPRTECSFLNSSAGEFSYASPVHSHVLLSNLNAGAT